MFQVRKVLSPATVVLCAALGMPVFAGFPLPPEATGRVYVSGSGSNKIFCFSADGSFLFDFTHEDLVAPRGLAFSDAGELFVGAQNADRVLVFDAEGSYRRQFTGGGLDGPTSVAFGPDGKLYVSSFSSNEILVYAEEEFERSITADGLRGPNCIAFDAEGRFLVASQLTNEVYRFEADGAPVGSFRGTGMSSPMGIAIWSDRIFVTGGGSSKVAVFDLDGVQLDELPTAPIRGPQGIAFDESGSFLTPSFYEGTIARFSASGEFLGMLEEIEIRTARSVVFEPITAEREPGFIRGDFNLDDRVDLSDPVAILGFLFLGQFASECYDAADTDDSGVVELTDAIYALAFLFQGGPQPPAPFPDAGFDPDADDLRCPERVDPLAE